MTKRKKEKQKQVVPPLLVLLHTEQNPTVPYFLSEDLNLGVERRVANVDILGFKTQLRFRRDLEFNETPPELGSLPEFKIQGKEYLGLVLGVNHITNDEDIKSSVFITRIKLNLNREIYSLDEKKIVEDMATLGYYKRKKGNIVADEKTGVIKFK